MNGLRGRLRGGLVLVALVVACAPEPEEYVGDDLTATFHGIMAFTAEGVSFRPCGLDIDFPVEDRTEGELVDAFRDLVPDPFGLMYTEVVGRYDPYEADRRPERFLVTELRRTAYETPGCEQDLEGILFRVVGWEDPVWIADITEERVMFTAQFEPGLVEFGAPVRTDTTELRVFEAATTDSAHTIRLTLHPLPCIDEKTGARYSWGAEAAVDTLYLLGCAAEGWL